jgi:FKBP-type peptidyl-prolyl cis-trans isomerase
MGRRRKRDQEFDGSLEDEYLRKRSKAEDGESSNETLKGESTASSTSLAGDGGDEKAMTTEVDVEIDKAEKNRLKKSRRKERKKEKAQERKDASAEAAKRVKGAKEEAFKRQQELKTEKKLNKEGEQALKESDWVQAALGVKYQDVVIGNGPVVEDRRQVRVKYKLRAKSFHGGKVVDSSSNFGFRLGRGEVIKGWDIGLAGMKHGGRRMMIVPPQAGYGPGKDVGAGKGGLLYFDVTLLAS